MGTLCPLCHQRCQIPEGGRGYCGVRYREEGRAIKGGRPHEGNLSWYFDPLPTNCVADFVCPGGTGCGYPRYAMVPGPEYGYCNLAVFYHACSFNCLYCQNAHFRQETLSPRLIPARELAEAVDSKTSCICYFGGDPTPQVLHALVTSKLALRKAGDRILRICWETNGAVREPLLQAMARLSLQSGGCIKVDLKAWTEEVHWALCGTSNQRTLQTIQKLARWIPRRPEPPLLIVSTTLVPGYVDEEEVRGIASFLAHLNPEIPYRLLAFHPQFFLKDLPTTSWNHAHRCQEVAQQEGLMRVEIGNRHLLSMEY